MAAKRALIVDDSKSARVVLSRMLQKYGIEVDAVESAESAIEYLTHSRPDVIFMDHLMPGMDGFQAVQAIKNNPHTATIPIMMYTSQQGELYVGQARALGAVGVLPKLIKPVDVSKVLYQLNLLPDRRDREPSAIFIDANPQEGIAEPVQGSTAVATKASSAMGMVPADWHPQLESALRNHDAELRRFVVASLDSFADRVSADIRNFINETPLLQVPPPPPEPRPPYGWIVAIFAALIPGIVLALFHTRALEANRGLSAENARLEQTNAQLARAVERMTPREPAPLDARSSTGSVGAEGGLRTAATSGESRFSANIPAVEPVFYGEIPLALRRVDSLRELLTRLDGQGFVGEVHVNSYAGNFCLAGTPTEGYALAPPETPANKCDLIGNPFDEGLSAAQRQSPAFANLVAGARKRSAGTLTVVTAHHGEPARDKAIAAYPASTAGVTAGQWNDAALRNNRVEFKVVQKP